MIPLFWILFGTEPSDWSNAWSNYKSIFPLDGILDYCRNPAAFSQAFLTVCLFLVTTLAGVVQKVDSTIDWINHCSVDRKVSFVNWIMIYLLNLLNGTIQPVNNQGLVFGWGEQWIIWIKVFPKLFLETLSIYKLLLEKYTENFVPDVVTIFLCRISICWQVNAIN